MNRKNMIRNALITSIISLLLCVSLLVGTTFAWFTDEVTTAAGNTMQSGTLQVALLDSDGNSLEGQPLTFVQKTEKGETEAITAPLWEPNATFITQQFKIVNEGNLYLKYTIVINGIDGDAKLNEVMEWSVIDGTGSTVAMTGTLAPNAETELVNLKGHMPETATNEYQGLSMTGIGITVYATQVEAEFDSFGKDYDADASYNTTVEVTPDTVQAALDAALPGDTIQLTAGDYGVLTLAPVYGSETTVLDSTTGNLSRSINGLTIKGADGAKVDGIKVSPMVGNTISLNNVVIDGVTFTGVAEGFLCNDGGATIKNFTMKNCTMTATGADRYDMVCIKSGTPENITITGCTVEGGLRLLAMTPSKNVTVTNNTISNVVEHGILLDNSGGRIHSGTIIVDNNYCYGANNRFIRFANMDDASVIITNNSVHQYKGGLDANPYEDDYIKVTYKNANVTPNVTIYGNEVNCANGSGYPTRGDLYISVNEERFVQP